MKVAVLQMSAREFFLTRIAKEAQEEGRPLTPAQRSIFESGGEYSRQQEAEFDRENPEYVNFIEWVTQLLRRALTIEMSRDPGAEKSYRAMLEELDKSEGGSPLWFAVVPAVHPPEPQRGVRFVWVIVAAILLVGLAIGFYLTKRSLW